MEIQRDLEVLENKFRYYQNAAGELRELFYDYKKCNGCGICVYSCPVNAIELGPVHDIALGLEMPPVILDHLKCAYCGICYSFCPFNAFEFKINGKRVEKSDLPLSPIAHTYKYENCKECVLCYKACPTGAIKREIFVNRQSIEEKNEIKGSLEIDREKCNLCGICAYFCEVFKMVEKEPNPLDPMPFSDILIDEGKCDYCKLCEDVCPEKAIRVEGKKISYILPEKIAEIKIQQELCSHCGYCEEVCPYEAIKTLKPIEGNLSTFEARMSKCDITGCLACLKVCKYNRVWYVAKDEGRVYFNDRFCIFCGACENACPYDLISIVRENYFTKEKIIDEPWRSAWEDAVERIIKKEKVREPLKLFIEEEESEEEKEETVIIRVVPEDVKNALEKVIQVLRTPRYRRAMEGGNLEGFLRGVEYALGEDKGEKE